MLLTVFILNFISYEALNPTPPKKNSSQKDQHEKYAKLKLCLNSISAKEFKSKVYLFHI